MFICRKNPSFFRCLVFKLGDMKLIQTRLSCDVTEFFCSTLALPLKVCLLKANSRNHLTDTLSKLAICKWGVFLVWHLFQNKKSRWMLACWRKALAKCDHCTVIFLAVCGEFRFRCGVWNLHFAWFCSGSHETHTRDAIKNFLAFLSLGPIPPQESSCKCNFQQRKMCLHTRSMWMLVYKKQGLGPSLSKCLDQKKAGFVNCLLHKRKLPSVLRVFPGKVATVSHSQLPADIYRGDISSEGVKQTNRNPDDLKCSKGILPLTRVLSIVAWYAVFPQQSTVQKWKSVTRDLHLKSRCEFTYALELYLCQHTWRPCLVTELQSQNTISELFYAQKAVKAHIGFEGCLRRCVMASLVVSWFGCFSWRFGDRKGSIFWQSEL